MERYQQQIALAEIGELGQQTLSNASVLVIGAGGLGVIVSSYLASMGIGNIGICDFDSIEESNLHRQFCYNPSEIGEKKSIILAKKLSVQNPGISIKAFTLKIDKDTIQDIANQYQLICDCTDQGTSRVIINQYCGVLKKTLVHGAVSAWQGYVTVFHHKKNFSLSDVFSFEDYLRSQNCADNGIMSPVCGLIASLMANESVKILLNIEDVLEGKLVYMNTLNNIFRIIHLKKKHVEKVIID